MDIAATPAAEAALREMPPVSDIRFGPILQLLLSRYATEAAQHQDAWINLASSWTVFRSKPDVWPNREEDLPEPSEDDQLKLLCGLRELEIQSVSLGAEQPHLFIHLQVGELYSYAAGTTRTSRGKSVLDRNEWLWHARAEGQPFGARDRIKQRWSPCFVNVHAVHETKVPVTDCLGSQERWWPEMDMCRFFLAFALAFSSSAASAFPVAAPKGTKVGSACIGSLKTLAPKLTTCSIVGAKKSRVWCPNGKAFDLDEAQAPPPLARSLCELTQVAD